MNQKKIRKLLHHMDEQTAKQIAEKYPATDKLAKEKIYHQICERRNTMDQQKEMISETYHTPNTKSVSWTKTFGVAAACLLVMGGTIGGIWKLTRLKAPSEDSNFVAENNSNTDTSATSPTESTITSETLTTKQAVAVIATSAATSTETNTTTVSVIASTTTKQTASTTTFAIIEPHRTEPETIAPTPQTTRTETKSEPIAPIPQTISTEPEPETTALPVETIHTETEPVTTRPAYLTAYLEICEEYENKFDELNYCLYDVDKDDIPELVINAPWYWMSIYSYADDQVYTVMDHYPYGVAGNGGYYFSPEYNSIYYSYTEYAGLIAHQVYLTITPEHTLEETDTLTTIWFDDLNQDGIPQEDEPNVSDRDVNYIGKYYHNGTELSKDEFDTWIMSHSPKAYINNRLDFKVYSDFLESLPE